MKKILAILLALSMAAGLGLASLAETIETEETETVTSQAEAAGEPAGPEEEPVAPEMEPADPQPEPAEEAPEKIEDPRAVGTWYGEIYGMPAELKLQNNGVYTLTIPTKHETRVGGWEVEGDLVLCDRDQAGRVVLHVGDGELAGSIDGIDVQLFRERPGAEDYTTVKQGVVLADFEGRWVCAKLGFGGVIVDAAGDKVVPMKLDITRETIVVSDAGVDGEPFTVRSTYANSVMTVALGAGTNCLIQPLANGMLRMSLGRGSDADTMFYYFERSTEEPEEEPEEVEEEPEEDAEETEVVEEEPEEDAEEPEEDTGDVEEELETVVEETPEEHIYNVIETRVTNSLTDTELEEIFVEPDGENYTASVSVTWQQKPGTDAREALGHLSDDLAAYVGQRCPNVTAIDVYWTVPRMDDASASLSYARGEKGMELAGDSWDDAFGE